jgi:hypothetical protein
MKTKYLILALLGIALSSCGHTSSSSPGVADASISSTSTSTPVILAQEIANSSTSDIQNATAAGNVTASEIALPFTFGGVVVASAAIGKSCVTIDVKSDTSTDFDVVWAFACPYETGTVEVSRVTSDGAVTNTLDTDLKQSNASSTLARDTDDSLVITRTGTAFDLAKKFDDTFTAGSDSYESQGEANDSFTPDVVVTPGESNSTGTVLDLNSGDVVINSTLLLSKNGTLENTYTVVSTDLHISSCGFDKGSIESKSNTDNIVITFTACGQYTINDNGVVVGPAPTPTPTPTETATPGPVPILPLPHPMPIGSPVPIIHFSN